MERGLPPLTDFSHSASVDVAIEAELPESDPESVSSLVTDIRHAVKSAVESRGFCRGRIGVLVTDNKTIRELNERHLNHDYPTDVISFTYSRSQHAVEGELVVSLCMAQSEAPDAGWDWRSELLLYVVHGTLHICGLEDSDEQQRREMRAAEKAVMSRLGMIALSPSDPSLEAESS